MCWDGRAAVWPFEHFLALSSTPASAAHKAASRLEYVIEFAVVRWLSKFVALDSKN